MLTLLTGPGIVTHVNEQAQARQVRRARRPSRVKYASRPDDRAVRRTLRDAAVKLLTFSYRLKGFSALRAQARSVQEQAKLLIDRLALEPHPEGGFYRQNYRSANISSIYYLLCGEDFSAFHQLGRDEIWHHYSGGPVTIEVIDPNGRARQMCVGTQSSWQAAIPAGSWFAAHLDVANSYALVGCDVAPPFTFSDFKIGERAQLAAEFPHHSELIERWTRS